ncbi:DUF3857 domain-containing protein [Psychroserpens sp. SPM9]|uniref:DUF3857 domain-containing protein n=1 Tax=Psychroserpens sp. SPM9 TaxID=2975598 RepID=UPI0021A70B92|nr:DUF3857 domain-containing protein [Psychroserpens sp. SPM9]MDG5490830.1 DUF3857 domain-containing protein [Psychroserpens sp. SPM9]
MNQNKNLHIYLFVLTFIALLPNCANAQYTREFDLIKNKYPDSKIVRLLEDVKISVALKDNELEVKQSFIEEDLYLDQSATYGSKRTLRFSAFFELQSVEATSYEYRDGKYKTHKVEEFLEKDELDDSFHDDTKSLNFIYPNLSTGSKTKLEYTEIVKNPRFLSPIYFGDFFPIKQKKVTLVADKDITFRFQEFNTEDYHIAFSKEEKRNTIIYTWEILDVDKHKHEDNVPSYQRVLPHIIPIITSYKSNDQTVNLLHDVSGLYQWYYSMVKDINLSEPDPNLVTLTKTLIKDKTTDLEKARAIYYWTQQNIKYIAFEYALGGFIPREANDVFKKKYGDCKDNSSILYEMLKIAGLEGHLTWIGTRSITYSYNEVPTPIVDNHMILSLKLDGKIYFLDATGRYLPIEMPSSFIQGKEALISNGETNYEIVEVPVMDPKSNSFKETNTLALEETNLTGRTTTEISGYYKIDFFNQLEDENTPTKIKDYYTTKLTKGNNKFLVDDVSEKNKYDYDKNLIVDYTFNINDYAKKLGDEIYVNLNLNRDASHYKFENNRENDIEVRYKSYYDYQTTLTVPEGYTVDYIPENYAVSNPFLEATISYENIDNSIVYKHTLEMKFLTLNAQEQKEVNSVIKTIEKNYKETLVFKKQ